MQIFSKRKRNDRFFFLNATSFGSTIGDLWDIYELLVAFYKCVSIIMLQKSSARKGFCAEGEVIKNPYSSIYLIQTVTICHRMKRDCTK